MCKRETLCKKETLVVIEKFGKEKAKKALIAHQKCVILLGK